MIVADDNEVLEQEMRRSTCGLTSTTVCTHRAEASVSVCGGVTLWGVGGLVNPHS